MSLFVAFLLIYFVINILIIVIMEINPLSEFKTFIIAMLFGAIVELIFFGVIGVLFGVGYIYCLIAEMADSIGTKTNNK